MSIHERKGNGRCENKFFVMAFSESFRYFDIKGYRFRFSSYLF